MENNNYPECEKLSMIADKSQICHDFISWLNEKGIYLCKYNEDESEYTMCLDGMEKLLSEFFDIDLNKVENERREMIESIRLASQS